MTQYDPIPRGYRGVLDNGAVLEVVDLDWTRKGHLYADVIVKTTAGEPLGSGKVQLSSTQDRYRLAQELASHNGSNPTGWANELLALWTVLDQERRDNAERFDPIDLSQFDEPETVQDAWHNLLPSGLISTMYGDFGQGKSTVVDGLAISMTMGWEFLGHSTVPGSVVLLDWELTRDLTLGRLYRIARGVGLTNPPAVFYQSMADPLGVHLDDIAEWCRNIQPGLVVVDSMGPACGGDPNDHEKSIALMNQIRKLGMTTWVVDHQSKPIGTQSYANKREFGSGYKRHLTRSSLQLEMASNDLGKASLVRHQQKNNFGPMTVPIAFHILYEGNAIKFSIADILDVEFQDTETLTTDRKIEQYLRETAGATKEQIMAVVGITSKTFDNNIAKVRNRGVIPKEPGRLSGGQRWYALKD